MDYCVFIVYNYAEKVCKTFPDGCTQFNLANHPTQYLLKSSVIDNEPESLSFVGGSDLTVSYNYNSEMNIADQTAAFDSGYLRMTTAHSAIGETATLQTFGGHKPNVQVIDNNFIKTNCVACSVIKYALSSSSSSVVSLTTTKITLNAQNNIEIQTDELMASTDIYVVATYDTGQCATLYNEPSDLM